VELFRRPHQAQEVLVVHPNAPLSPEGRWRLVRLIVEDGWSVARAAERLQVSRTTAYRWLGRYQQLGRAGLVDRPSRPHRMPRLTPASVVRKIAHLRTTRRWGPVAIGARLGLAASTVHRVLVRLGRNRLAWTDRASGLPVRRYEHPTREAWSMSTSRSSATFPKVAATGSTAARPAGALARPTGPAAG
jgi:transposase